MAKESFELPHRTIWSIALGLVWVPVAMEINLTDPVVLATLALVVGLTAIGFWFLNVLIVSDDGMRLNQLNYMKWQDVESAKLLKFFGLKYLKVSQPHGFSWWIPLYYVGKNPLMDTLNLYSPDDHPIRAALLVDRP